jgi:Glycosyltransferase family 87
VYSPAVHPINATWPGRVVRSPAWPFAMLVIGGLLLVGGPSTTIRGFALPVVIGVSLAIATGTWVTMDLLRERRGLSAPLATAVVAVLIAIGAVGVAVLDIKLRGASRLTSAHVGVLAALAGATGVYARLAMGHRRVGTQLAFAAAMSTWAPYLDITLLVRPFRDAGLYLTAGRTFLDGHPVYITAPLTSIPADWTQLPYLYPPFTLPVFGALAALPHWLGLGILELACFASVIAGLRLLGVGWRFVPVLALWPPLAIGVQVGNVACLGFLVLAAAWRYQWSVPLGGVFKAQTGILSLWLLRERKWRALAIGALAVVALVLVTLPLTGVQAYLDWLHALAYFQASLAQYPSSMGLALQRLLDPITAIVLTVGAVVVALLGRRRDGLARSAVAAVVASPTLYMHGLALFLPAILFLDAASFWVVLALMPWGTAAWRGIVIAVVALALGLTRARLAVPADGPEPAGEAASPATLFDEAAHPLGRRVEPWPDPGDPGGDIVPEPVRRWSNLARYRLGLGRGDGVGRGEAEGTGDGV